VITYVKEFRQYHLRAMSSHFSDGSASLFGVHERGFYSASHPCVFVPKCAFSVSYNALDLYAPFDLRIDALVDGKFETLPKLHAPDIYAALTHRLRLMLSPKLKPFIVKEYADRDLYLAVRRRIDGTGDLHGFCKQLSFQAVLPYEYPNQPRNLRIWSAFGETFNNVAASTFSDTHSRIQHLLDPHLLP